MWHLIAPIISPVVEKVLGLIPDPNARAEAKESLERDLQKAVMDAATMQNQVNIEQAKHSSVFVAGARPAILWVCACGLFWAYIIQPLAVWAFLAFLPGVPPPPAIDTDSLYQLVLAILGMAGLRTFERAKGVIPPGR